MHFFYLDEAGCTGRDLSNPEQPIFVLGALVISDEKWNSTKERFNRIVSRYFAPSPVPADFELHTEELLSPHGDGPFLGHDRTRRNQFANQMLDLLANRSHHFAYFAIDKSDLVDSLPANLQVKDYVDFTAPYIVSFDYMLSLIEWYAKVKLGRSARAMLILDEKAEFEQDIRSVVRHQKYLVPQSRRLKWIVEFSYPINSHMNPMVQLADLVSFLTKKYLEIENGYRDSYDAHIKDVYRDFYKKIDDRLIRKGVVQTDTRVRAASYYELLNSIRSSPSRGWRNKVY